MARVEILAGLGTGKTSLAKIFEKHSFIHVEEDFEKNPFLTQIYEDGNDKWLEYGVTNLMLHFNQLRKNNDTSKNYIFDFSLVLDRAYAQTHLELGLLTPSELKVYEALDKEVRAQAPKADLCIHLVCGAKEQKNRILSRGREYEKNVSEDFLEMMSKNTKKALKDVYQETNVLVIDTEKYDYVNNSDHIKKILNIIGKQPIINDIFSAYTYKPNTGQPKPSIKLKISLTAVEKDDIDSSPAYKSKTWRSKPSIKLKLSFTALKTEDPVSSPHFDNRR
jgi:deoxyguanosine kinase